MNINRALAMLALLCAAALGSTVELHAQLGPILQVVHPSFDTTLCGTSECRDVIFRNVGDAPMQVLTAGPIPAPFSGVIPTPFTLFPGAERRFQICYNPLLAPARDTQTVPVLANGRVSLSIAMLFDTSGSMGSQIGGPGGDTSSVTIRRIAAANAAGRRFVGTLVDTLGIRDTVAICRFSDGYAVTLGFTTDKNQLLQGVPSGTGGRTCLYRAIIQTNQLLRTQNVPGRRVMIVLADGADDGCGGVTLNDVLDNAMNPDPIKVFTVGIGAADAGPLQQIAAATGGQFFTANDEQDLMAVYDSIAVLLSRNMLEQPFQLSARAVTPIMTLNPTFVDFDSTRIGVGACRTIMVTNTGDAPLDINAITGFNAEFTLASPAVPTVQPGESLPVQICYMPSRLRVQTGSGAFAYNSCTPRSLSVSLRGVGYDSLVVEVRDTVQGTPGTFVEIPVYLREPLPASYDVNTYEIALSYNKTMLYPADTFVVADSTLSALLLPGVPTTVYNDSMATTLVTFSGNTLQSADSNSTLVRLRFLVLHGNAMQTPVRIASARFADGNPKLGLASPLMFDANGLCYQQQRLIDASARYGGLLKMVATEAGGNGATVRYEITEPSAMRLALYDGLGREIALLADGHRDTGEYEVRFGLQGLPRGVYYLRLETGSTQDVKLLVLSN